jgi:DNA-binding MarR family transcriptional regulator
MPATASTVDVAGLATRLRVAIWRTARRLRGAAEADLSPTALAALGTIERHGPMTPGQFARHEQIRKPTATRTIAALVERGLVGRTPDPLDGRVAWLQLTTDGRRLLTRVRRRYDAFLAERIKQLAPEDRAVLERAAGILEAIVDPPEGPP